MNQIIASNSVKECSQKTSLTSTSGLVLTWCPRTLKRKDMETHPFREMLGILRYLVSCTRRDLCNSHRLFIKIMLGVEFNLHSPNNSIQLCQRRFTEYIRNKSQMMGLKPSPIPTVPHLSFSFDMAPKDPQGKRY